MSAASQPVVSCGHTRSPLRDSSSGGGGGRRRGDGSGGGGGEGGAQTLSTGLRHRSLEEGAGKRRSECRWGEDPKRWPHRKGCCGCGLWGAVGGGHYQGFQGFFKSFIELFAPVFETFFPLLILSYFVFACCVRNRRRNNWWK